MASMLEKGQINRPYLWIDTYNQRTSDICGTIKARIDSNCMYFVSVPESSMQDTLLSMDGTTKPARS